MHCDALGLATVWPDLATNLYCNACVYFGNMCGDHCQLYFHLLRTFEGNSPTIFFTYCERLRVIHLLFFAFFTCLQMGSLLVNAITHVYTLCSHAGYRLEPDLYEGCLQSRSLTYVMQYVQMC